MQKPEKNLMSETWQEKSPRGRCDDDKKRRLQDTATYAIQQLDKCSNKLKLSLKSESTQSSQKRATALSKQH